MHSSKLLTAALALLIVCMFVTSLFSQSSLTVGEVTALPGEAKSGYIRVPAGEDGPETVIPVTVINGNKPGPALALVAAVHGYEYPPVLALYRLKDMVDPMSLSGSLILVHVANVPSFLKRIIYYNPYDWQNLNRVFPGKKDGTSCERIAWQLTTQVIDQCDVLIDNHCGDGNEDLMPYLYCSVTGDTFLDKQIHGLAVSYGLKLIVEDKTRPDDVEQSLYCSNTAITRGKPAITIEAGKLGRSDEEDIQRVLRGSLNIMKHLEMIPGKIEKVFESVWVQKYTIIRAEQDGIFYPLVSRADHVQEGELVGYLTNLLGERVQDVVAPYNGIVLYVIGTPPMSKGEPMASIGLFK